MNLGMLDRFCPSLKTRALLDGIKFDRSDKIMIDMLCLCIERMFGLIDGCRILERIFLQANYHDPSAQYKRGWGSFKRKRGLTLCYSCKKSGHLAKECPRRRPNCLCCKAMNHEVLDFPRMISNLEEMNMRQENPKKGQETKTMKEPQKESETILLQMKETLNEHQNIDLSEIFKEKECIETRI